MATITTITITLVTDVAGGGTAMDEFTAPEIERRILTSIAPAKSTVTYSTDAMAVVVEGA